MGIASEEYETTDSTAAEPAAQDDSELEPF